MKKKQIIIIDYKLGNLFSVQQAINSLGHESVITSDAKTILNADYAILPGVGAYGEAMSNLHKLDLSSAIVEFISSGKPFMGICLGLQLLFTESEEFGSFKGLNVINGTVKKFSTGIVGGERIKVPQIAWNKIFQTKEHKWKNSPLRECVEGEFMYFVHSYYIKPSSDEVVLATTAYGDINYCSAIAKDNIFACQFHPEKSSSKGISIYRNWLEK